MVAVLFLAAVAVWGYVLWASSGAVYVYDRLVAYAGLPGARAASIGSGSLLSRVAASIRPRRRRTGGRSGWAYSPAEMAAAGLDPSRLDVARYAAGTAGAACGVLLGVIGRDPAVGLLMASVLFAAGMMAVRVQVRSRMEARRKRILREFPEALELLSVAMTAGLSFDRAVQTMVLGGSGPVADLFRVYLEEVAVGKPPSRALLDLAERSGVQEVREFVTHAVQSRRYGMSLSDILRAQSEHMRRVLRARQREAAGRASVQMLLPMVLCVFPVTFLLTVAPVIIRVLQSGVFR